MGPLYTSFLGDFLFLPFSESGGPSYSHLVLGHHSGLFQCLFLGAAHENLMKVIAINGYRFAEVV